MNLFSIYEKYRLKTVPFLVLGMFWIEIAGSSYSVDSKGTPLPSLQMTSSLAEKGTSPKSMMTPQILPASFEAMVSDMANSGLSMSGASSQSKVEPRMKKINPENKKPLIGPPPSAASATDPLSPLGKLDKKKAKGARVKSLIIEKNMAEFIEFEEQVSEVFVANPEIVDVQVDGTTGGYIFARKLGSTTIMVRSVDGDILHRLNIRVTHNMKDLREIIRRTYPNENIRFDSTPTGILLSGPVSSSVVAKDIENITTGFLGDREKVTNGTSISSPTQIMLKVKIAEVNRAVLNQFGINWSAISSPKHFMYGVLMGRTPISDGSVVGIPAGAFIPGGVAGAGQPPLNSYAVRYRDSHNDVTSLLDALDAEDLATVLAEPNLMAVSGETASFLVGGEFPYPVPQNNTISVQFKEYGIRLSFTPTVLDASRISLKVAPEVSELDDTNKLSVTVYGGTATEVPAIKSRKAETSVELGDGQSLAIAGLISSSMRNHYDDIPGLGDIPILGSLFRSTKFRKDQSELVITVTPYLVKPTDNIQDLKLPTDNLKRASNLDMLLYQRLNREENGKMKDNCAPEDIHLAGHAGFNVE